MQDWVRDELIGLAVLLGIWLGVTWFRRSPTIGAFIAGLGGGGPDAGQETGQD
jgi:hypothetical protein